MSVVSEKLPPVSPAWSFTKEGIERQVRSVVFLVIDKHQARIEQQQEQRPRRAAKIG